MTRRTIDAALLLLIAANAHHILVFACRVAISSVARALTACDIDRLIDDLEQTKGPQCTSSSPPTRPEHSSTPRTT